ncbi:hypothetical protein [Falsibacillus pallidus]|uniref:DUF3052 family protein n=1 Tax=Falsibacillus pallidus TaxID=493781 RepID=A0A370GNZ6_9BACI|nr:hypothetical protein [Falsibacillus pallidus]RDI45448.1 hypothetical protein DFR59_10275 [Falsibacillus pallidus]
MNELAKKLRYKEGYAAKVFNAPEGYSLDFEQVTDEEELDFIQLYVKNSSELNGWLPKVLPLLKEDGVFWITYPKKTSKKVETDLNRDILAEKMMQETIFRPVSNAAVDAAWSALRFREKEKVKSKK